MLRLRHLSKTLNYKLHVKWQCEFRDELKADPEMRSVYDELCLAVNRPLDPRRDALRGGRTEAFRVHYSCRSEDEEIIVTDIVS